MFVDMICPRCSKQFRGEVCPSHTSIYCGRGCSARVSRNKRHGMTESILNHAWRRIRMRCNNPNHHAYSRYGGRGIKVCERWNVFENFLADMGPKPSPEYTLERIDNDGDYEPSNCKWATRAEQNRNKSDCYTAELDAKIREAVALGLNFRQMAEFVGKPQGSVTARTYRLGLKSGTPPIPPKPVKRRTTQPVPPHDRGAT